MNPAKITRINELARKKRTVGLTESEIREQQTLYREYLAEFCTGMEQTLEGVRLKRPDGTLEKLEKKQLGK